MPTSSPAWGNAQCAPPIPGEANIKRLGAVDQEIKMLSCCIEELNHRFVRLGERLMPVLGSALNQPGTPPKDQPSVPPLAEKIRECRLALELITGGVQALTERIEI